MGAFRPGPLIGTASLRACSMTPRVPSGKLSRLEVEDMVTPHNTHSICVQRVPHSEKKTYVSVPNPGVNVAGQPSHTRVPSRSAETPSRKQQLEIGRVCSWFKDSTGYTLLDFELPSVQCTTVVVWRCLSISFSHALFDVVGGVRVDVKNILALKTARFVDVGLFTPRAVTPSAPVYVVLLFAKRPFHVDLLLCVMAISVDPSNGFPAIRAPT